MPTDLGPFVADPYVPPTVPSALSVSVKEYAKLLDVHDEYKRSAIAGVPSVLSAFGVPRPTSVELANAWIAVVRAAAKCDPNHPPYLPLGG